MNTVTTVDLYTGGGKSDVKDLLSITVTQGRELVGALSPVIDKD